MTDRNDDREGFGGDTRKGFAGGERDGRDDREELAGDVDERAGGEREEYADWSLPGADEPDGPDEDDEALEPPPMMREPLFRDRIRDRLGLGPRQWFVLETFLLAAPYPVFVLVYFSFDVGQTLFIAVTLVYSLVAMYVGLLS